MKQKLHNLLQEIKAAETRLSSLNKKLLNHDSAYLASEKSALEKLPIGSEGYKNSLSESDIIHFEDRLYPKVGEWTYCFESDSIAWSSETYQIFEYPENYKGSINEFYMSSIDDKTLARLPEMMEIFSGKGKGSVMSQTIITPSGKRKMLSFSCSAIRKTHGEATLAKGYVKDITDEINGKSGLDNFFNMSNDLHCITHLDRYFVKVSPAWINLLGYTEKELLSRSYMEFIHPDDINETDVAVNNVDKDSVSLKFENRYIKKTGEVVYLSWRARIDPETDLGYCTARDVTESKIARDELLSDLSGKELLLREIHHRVKNNLQIITSLLSLQAGTHTGEDHLVRLYEDSRNRIQSMASIHEMFYQSEELDKIEFGKYLDKLIGDLSRSLTFNQKPIDLILDIESVYVNLDMAIPLGLLINEIVTNSIKYGADNDNVVKIFVKLEVIENDYFQLIIGDHGVNGPRNILSSQIESLGLLLINSLVEQINGEISQLDDYPGIVYKLVFKGRI